MLTYNAIIYLGFFFGIVLCFVVIPYKCFIPLTKSPFIDGLVSSFFYGYILAILTMYFWYIAAIILILIGLGLMGKTENSKAKKVIMCVFLALAIAISIIGIKVRNDKNASKDIQEEAYDDYDYDDYDDYDDTEDIYYDDTEDGTSVEASNNAEVEVDGISDDTDVGDDLYEENYEDVQSEYIFPYSDSEYLEAYEVEELSAEKLRIARNEIYARHGRKFKDKQLQEYFDSCSWYEGTIEPDEFNDDTMLNEYERYNRDLIQNYEND